MKSLLLLLSLCGALNACGGADSPTTAPAPTSTAELIVDSGFEPGTELFVYNPNILGLRGIDTSRTQSNDWGFRGATSTVGDFYFKMEQNATPNDRYASIIRDPLNSSNAVVSLFLKKPTEVDPTKGRIQMEIGENKRLTDALISYRLFLNDAYAGLKDYTYQSGDWLTLMELWGGPDVPASERYPFRLTLYLIKSLDNTQIEYGLRAEKIDRSAASSGQEPWQVVWEQRSKAGAVPIGEWIDVEVYYHEGDVETGRFYLSVKRKNEAKTVVFDVHDVTRHPLDPSPLGLRWINPVKIYCSEGILKHLSNKGQTLGLMLDDFKFWKNKKP